MADTLFMTGFLIGLLGKLVGVGYIALTEHKSTVPWIVLVLCGYAVCLGGQLAGGGV